MSQATSLRRAEPPLATLIHRAGIVPADRLEHALAESESTGKRLPAVLLERGWVDETALARLLGELRRMPLVPLSGRELDLSAARFLPEEVARLNRAVAVGFRQGTPVVVIEDPTDDNAFNAVRSALGREGLFGVATRSEISATIDRAYARPEPVLPEPAPVVWDEPSTSAEPSEPSPAPVPSPVDGPAPALGHEHLAPPELDPPSPSAEGPFVPPAPAPAATIAASPEPPVFDAVERPNQPVAPADDGQRPSVRHRPDAPLGTLIFRAGLLSEEQLEQALGESMRTGRRLGQVLLQWGWLNEADLARLLAGQRGFEFVELAETDVEREAAKLLSEELMRRYHVVPFAFEGDAVVVAIEDPRDEVAMEAVRAELGPKTRFVIATKTALVHAIGSLSGETSPPIEVEERAPATPAKPASLVLRLANGETVTAASFEDEDAALARAEQIIRRLAETDGAEWPFLNGRYINPATLISLDITTASAP